MFSAIAPETLPMFRQLLKQNKNSQYLLSYTFTGLDNCIKSQFLRDLIPIDEFERIIFRYPTTKELTAEEACNYATSYLACLVALDRFITVANNTDHLFTGNQADYRIFGSFYDKVEDWVQLIFETVGAGVRQVFTWHIRILPDQYTTKDNLLDRTIYLDGPGFGGRYLDKQVSLKDLNFRLIEKYIQDMEW